MMLRERLKNVWAKCPRLHRSSVVVGFLVAGVFLLLAFPGEPVEYNYYSVRGPIGYGFDIRYSHGWPWQWYDRAVSYDRRIVQSVDVVLDGGVSWLKRDGWLVFSRNHRSLELTGFNFATLLGDVAVGCVTVALVAGLWEWRRRRRHSVWQFTMRDCMALVAVFSLAFGYCAYLQRAHIREKKINLALLQLGCQTNLRSTEIPWRREPVWLRRLVGGQRVPKWFSYVEKVHFDDSWDDKIIDLMPHLEELDHLETITIRDTDERPIPLSHLGRLPSLRELYLGEYDIIDEETVEQLKTLKQLELLTIGFGSSLSISARQELAKALPHCQIVVEYDE